MDETGSRWVIYQTGLPAFDFASLAIGWVAALSSDALRAVAASRTVGFLVFERVRGDGGGMAVDCDLLLRFEDDETKSGTSLDLLFVPNADREVMRGPFEAWWWWCFAMAIR